MRETPEEVAELERMFDATLTNINPHFAAIVKPTRRLTAQQVLTHLQGTQIVAFSKGVGGTVHLLAAPRG